MTRTVVAQDYGGPEVLALQDIELRALGPTQVLVDVRAAGVDRSFRHLRTGHVRGNVVRVP